MSDAVFDGVVFGATSFVGRLICRHLAERENTNSELRWAMAGRSPTRLEALCAELGRPRQPRIVADASDPASLRALCARTRVVLSTVGPYARFGEPLVRACAETGTDYCDLTGEIHWIRQMQQRYADTARASGARLVHCCGFDSLPSDLGVLFLQEHAGKRFGAPCPRVKMRVRAAKGGFSGGTVASMIGFAEDIRKQPGLRREIADPYSICPPGARPSIRQPRVRGAAYDADADSWIAPFVMASVNEHVVHRSNALSGQAYGADFRYDEAVLAGRGPRGRATASAVTLGLGGFLLGVALRPSRALLRRFVLPAAGQGPSPEAQERGFFDIRVLGIAADGQRLTTIRINGARDPGYGATSRMAGEALACLAQDADADAPGGFWTPATLLGPALIERLRRHAGIAFEVLDNR